MSEERKFIVYLATNMANGKRYVGFTSVGLDSRRAQHHKQAFGSEKRATRLHAALRKYGRDAFVWTVVAVLDTAAEGFAEEIRLIAELKPEYNVSAGGEGVLGLPAYNRKPVTCLTDGKMFVSATAAGKHYGLGQTAVFEICSGKYRSAANKLHFIWGDIEYSSIDRARLIREIEDAHALRRRRDKTRKPRPDGIKDGRDAAGRRATGPAKLGRPVICVSDGKEYPSASAAARAYDVDKSALIELCLCKNGRQTVGGHRFEYVEK